MNCIFCCVFNQLQYVDMFYIFLESILVYGNLDDNTIILVYTSTSFMNMIKEHILFNDAKIFFEINDTYNNIDKACKSRLDLFNLSSITKYDKILYLDTDIIVKDDINKVFDVCKEDKLYTLEEGEIDSDTDYWGKILFGNELNIYSDKTAFSSGILLFNNCEKIKDLFNKINDDISNRPNDFNCFDQPYIVYNAFKYNLYNNKILKSFAVNGDNNIHSDKVIHHFPGGPGMYGHKIIDMTNFRANLKYILVIDKFAIQNEYEKCSSEKQQYLHDIKKIIIDSNSSLEGNSFYHHASLNLYSDLYTKQLNLFWCGKQAITRICEIGFNAGHSSMLMLLGRDKKPLDFTIFDIGHHSYTKPCLKYIESKFQHINFEYIEGDSILTMPKWIETNKKYIGSYDVVHVDGGHSEHCISNDMKNADIFVKKGGIVIVDDTNMDHINNFVNLYLSSGKYREIDVLKTIGYPHRIIQKKFS